MGDLFVILVTLLILLGIVAAVGHGLWVLVAMLFRSPPPERICPFCEKPTSGSQRCDVCFRDLAGRTAAELRDLRVAERLLRRLRENGRLRSETVARLLTWVDQYRTELIRGPAQRAGALADQLAGRPEAVRPAAATAAPPKPAAAPPPEGLVSVEIVPEAPTGAEAQVRGEGGAQALPTQPVAVPPARPPAKPPAAPLRPPVPPPPAPPPTTPPLQAPPPPAPPKRSWTDLLAAFAEERNIRWGELIGGLLFVGSSIALVISLWEELERIPYFQFFIFAAVSAAVFGVGLYAHWRLKLEATSHGLLIIASLLVPLNFVAMAELSQSKPPWDPLGILAQATALALFGWLTYRAERIIVPGAKGLLVAALVGCSATVILSARLIQPDGPQSLVLACGGVPMLLFAAAVLGYVRLSGSPRHMAASQRTDAAGEARAGTVPISAPQDTDAETRVGTVPISAPQGMTAETRAERKWGLSPSEQPTGQHNPARIVALLTMLGIAGFAMLASALLVVAKASSVDGTLSLDLLRQVLEPFSLLQAVATLPLLAVGLATARLARRAELAAYEAAGTTLVLCGMLGMVLALAFAWPVPGWLIATGALQAAALATLAMYWRAPLLHAGAIASLAIAYLTAFHAIAGDFSSLDRPELQRALLLAFTSAASGSALAALFVFLAAVSETLARMRYRRHALVYMVGSAVAAVAGLALVTFHGWRAGGGDALRAAILYFIYGVGSLALAARWRSAPWCRSGLGLLAASVAWALWWHPRTCHVGPLWAAVVAAESLAMAALAMLWRAWREKGGRHHLCAAPSGPFRQMVPTTFFPPPVTFFPPPIRRPRATLAEVFTVSLAGVSELLAGIALALGVVTLWRDRAALEPPLAPPIAAACLAVAWLVLAGLKRSPARTWVAGGVALAGCIHTLIFHEHFADRVAQPWLVALLGHASVAFALCAAFKLRAARLDADRQQAIDRVYSRPLADLALISGALALPALILADWSNLSALSGCLFWLAGLALALAWWRDNRELFIAHQATLTLAVLTAATAWMQNREWIVRLPVDLFRLDNLQVYGIGLMGLSLAWVLVRAGVGRLVRGLPADASRAEGAGAGPFLPTPRSAARLLLTAPSVDWFAGHAVVALQWLLTLVALLPALGVEIFGLPERIAAEPRMGAPAWILCGLSAAWVVASLWDRFGAAELIAGLLTAAAAGHLGADRLASEGTAASGVRWGLAALFVIASAFVWLRRPLGRGLAAIGTRVLPGPGAKLARPALAAIALAPVLGLTLVGVVFCGYGFGRPPSPETFFGRLGPTASYALPLVILALGLVGHALRERLGRYAFAAGLVVEAAIAVTFALGTLQLPWAWDAAARVELLQWLILGAAAWAIAWLAVRPWLDIWPEDLMAWQVGMALIGNLFLIFLALMQIALLPWPWQDAAGAVGGPVGWAALAVTLVAATWWGRAAAAGVSPWIFGAIVLASATVRGLEGRGVEPVWAFRELMLGFGGFALLSVLAQWLAPIAPYRPVQRLLVPAKQRDGWIGLAIFVAVFLALRAALGLPGERLWAAGGVALATAAGTAAALWRRREDWAFLSAVGGNLAASLAVWHYHAELPLTEWLVLLVQANIIAAATAGMIWLALRRRLAGPQEGRPVYGLLDVQIALPVAANLVLLAIPLLELTLDPTRLPRWTVALSHPPGWAALALTATALGWHLRLRAPGSEMAALGGLALAAPVFLACAAPQWEWPVLGEEWAAYRCLLAGWTAAGAALLLVAMGVRSLRGESVQDASPQPAARPSPWSSPVEVLAIWATLVDLLALGYVILHGGDEPLPWWPAGVTLAVAVTAAATALWRPSAAHVYLAGLAPLAAATILWHAFSDARGADYSLGLIRVNLLCLSGGSILWTLLRRAMPRRVLPLDLDGTRLHFAHAATLVAAGAMIVLTIGGLSRDLANQRPLPIDAYHWGALAAVALATALAIGEGAVWAPAVLYLLGLTAIASGLWAADLAPRAIVCLAVVPPAAFALAVAAILQLLPRDNVSLRPLAPLQAVVAAAAAALSVWLALDFRFDGVLGEGPLGGFAVRAAAPAAALLVAAAAAVMAAAARTARAAWQHACLGLGVLAMAELGWSCLSAAAPHLWFHRSVILMSATAVGAALAGVGLPLLVGGRSDWAARGRQAALPLTGLALAMLAAVLVQEAELFLSRAGLHMPLVEVVAVAAALAVLVAACLAFTVRRDLDPLGLDDSARQAYVYAAELLGALVALHIRMSRPLFFHGLVRRHWMLVVMAVAFGGAALSEWFRRRKLEVLAKPLERTALALPLLPVIGFWFVPQAGAVWSPSGRAPIVWWMIAAFYGVVAVRRPSALCGLLAVLTANIGLWVALDRVGVGFFDFSQVWLIPIALAALVAEQLNRGRLRDDQATAARYFALSVIYVSSTVDMYHAGLGTNWYMPVVLMVLSVLGVLSGIVLRVRSFLYLGVTFLAVDVLSMIRYAAVDLHQTWIWWACGIVLGAAILALFAFFELRRNEVLRALERLREWER